MAESASVALSNEQAEQFVFQLSNEARAVLYRALWDSSIDQDMLEELNVEAQTIAQIEAGNMPKVICPHVGCETVFDYTDLRQYSYHQRVERVRDAAFDRQNDFGWGYVANDGYDDGDAWSDRALFCPNCNMPVAPPKKWRIYDVN